MAAIVCPDKPDSGIRMFRLEMAPGAQCWDYDLGNVPNKTSGRNQDVFFEGDGGPREPFDGLLHVPAGFSLLDKSDQTGDPFEGLLTGTNGLTRGLSGEFNIAGNPAWQYLIIFKTGVARGDPDWAAFLLPRGVLSGSWSIDGQQALSHVQVWGGGDQQTLVPLPAAVWLLGSGLLGLFAVGRRRKGAQAAAA
jgi:hypothetical protein